MAVFTAFQSFDLSPDSELLAGFGEPTIAPSPMAVSLTGENGVQVVLLGGFTGTGDDLDGTISAAQVRVAGVLVGEASGLSLSFAQARDLLVAEDFGGFAALLLQGNDVITGSPFPDTLLGGAGNDLMQGRAGDDWIEGGTGSDFIYGGQGSDFIRGMDGNDLIRADLGDDWHLNGNKGDDIVLGGLGNDTVHGGQGADTLIGDDADGSGQGGNDFLSGDLGDDDLYGDFGDDTLAGGAGADRFFFFSAEGDDLVLDFNGAEGDMLMVEEDVNGTGVATFAQLQTRITSDGAGGSLIDLGAGNSVHVLGVAPGTFTAEMVDFFTV